MNEKSVVSIDCVVYSFLATRTNKLILYAWVSYVTLVFQHILSTRSDTEQTAQMQEYFLAGFHR